jgi:predicted metal-dependent phosphoesterase TrpH
VPADLHCHTTASDGVHPPTELVRLAKERGLDAVGITDHDTLGGIDEGLAAGARFGVRVVPGIEMSARAGDRSVHVLGYFVDRRSERLASTLDDMRVERLDRARRIVERLCELGYEITFEEVERQAHGAIIARPHVARALVARGYVSSIRDAFTPELIGDGGRAEVPRDQITPHEAIELIGDAGGAAVLGHPGLKHHLGTHDPVPTELIEDLVAHGLAGLEVDHPDHDPDMRERLRELAARLGVITTGGSDFHGESGRRLGTCTTSAEAVQQLENAASG